MFVQLWDSLVPSVELLWIHTVTKQNWMWTMTWTHEKGSSIGSDGMILRDSTFVAAEERVLRMGNICPEFPYPSRLLSASSHPWHQSSALHLPLLQPKVSTPCWLWAPEQCGRGAGLVTIAKFNGMGAAGRTSANSWTSDSAPELSSRVYTFITLMACY